MRRKWTYWTLGLCSIWGSGSICSTRDNGSHTGEKPELASFSTMTWLASFLHGGKVWFWPTGTGVMAQMVGMSFPGKYVRQNGNPVVFKFAQTSWVQQEEHNIPLPLLFQRMKKTNKCKILLVDLAGLGRIMGRTSAFLLTAVTTLLTIAATEAQNSRPVRCFSTSSAFFFCLGFCQESNTTSRNDSRVLLFWSSAFWGMSLYNSVFLSS